ncbi:hypothetical protein [Solemya velum gill symbiont]|uniref:Uncharacterized protein n=2 Tax=Solemya velum gill symbiont TaxID=2340 RepID=A0A0B0HEN8_SOVGS|nr:hypothetical protein [Solemya velum gill symbiont]KHF25901.1 hypothetical protein JV46_13560 [Solemya velum gill symbiont]OOY52469.1 hypothetical protein BOV97_05750 [Solemya velum gill symbiont]OOY54565.1 hypothetical protein BOV99_10590 [Solemya velum gill symbiont]OOY55103.1 hypothetical protein BOW00_10595 [Solemya velum gill symbiont]OOY60657.1 hypothetical protein BOW02_05095 [Solemya velum gill symbiont]
MPANDNHIDLRLNRGQTDHNESFWPSFTDIMTVIVMIFLLAMVVLLVKNTELVTQLRETLASERAASSMAIQVSQEKKTLNKILEEKQTQISLLEGSVTEFTERDKQRLAAIAQLKTKENNQRVAIEKLQTRESQQLATIQQLENKGVQQQAAIEQLKSRETQQLATIEQLKKLESEQLAVIEQLKKKESEQLAAIEQLRSSESSQLSTIEQLKNRESERLSIISQLQEREKSLSANKEELSANLEATQQMLSERDTELQKQRDLVTSMQQEYDALLTEKDQLVADLQGLDSKSRNEVKILGEELARKIALITTLEQTRDEQQVSIESMREQLETQRELTSEAQAAFKASELANSEKANEIAALRSRQEELDQQSANLNTQIAELLASLDLTKNNLTEKNEALSSNQAQLQTLQLALDEKTAELETAVSNIKASQQHYTSLETEFNDLKVEYDKLFRPARTKESKYIVKTVHLPDNSFEVTVPGHSPRVLSLADTDALLAKIAEEHCSDLYVHIIFPKSDTISHAEAWRLTSQLHKHDYYYSNRNCE